MCADDIPQALGIIQERRLNCFGFSTKPQAMNYSTQPLVRR